MVLELRKIAIRSIEFGSPARIEGDKLIVDPDEMKEWMLEDSRIKNVSFDIALPGTSTRILPVKDVIEPRAKIEGETFPGLFREDMEEGGSGVTYCLDGCVVTTTGPIVGFQEGVIDMSGPAAEYNVYSKLCHLVMILEKQDYVDPHEHEEVVRLAGIKLARKVGELAFPCENYTT